MTSTLRITIETANHVFQLNLTKRYELTGRELHRTTRLYAGDVLDMSDVTTPPYGMKGENAENDKAWRAYNREEVRRMNAGIDKARPELYGMGCGNMAIGKSIMDTEGVVAGTHLARLLSETKRRFSRKAGCSCRPSNRSCPSAAT